MALTLAHSPAIGGERLPATASAGGPVIGSQQAVTDWAFQAKADAFTPDALLDLRRLNEANSGQSGFVRLSADGSSFVLGDGSPVRFWAIGSEALRRPSGADDARWQEALQRHCRFLAKRGVNMVRLHLTIADTSEGASIDEVDSETLEGVFRFVAAAKSNGIYLTISPYYANHRTPTSWRLDGYSRTHGEPWGALFLDPRLQDAYRVWTRKLYTTRNPFTGLPIAEDPTVAILQVHNEDSVFFWTFGALPDEQKTQAAQLFGDWLTERYGSLQKAAERWPNTSSEFDDFDRGRAGLLGPYEQSRTWGDQRDIRLRDEVEFLAELQRDFYATTGRFLRDELGCRQLLNASNWRTANDERLKAIERWTYAALDIDAENEYFGLDDQHVGEHSNYRIDAGHFLQNRSCLFSPFEHVCNYKSQPGRPFLLTETSWKNPNLYQAEGPFLVALYQSLSSVDGVYWFTALEPEWCVDPRRKMWPSGDSLAHHKWSCSTPMLLGMFPAAAVTFRNGYIAEGSTVARIERTLDSILNRDPPKIDDNEIYQPDWTEAELGSGAREGGRISRSAFLVGAVSERLGAPSNSTEVVDFSSAIDPDAGAIAASNGQAVWNYRLGFCTMDCERAQGVAGFLKDAGGQFRLQDTLIESQDEYAAVSVVSLDGMPLRTSGEVLIQIGSTARLTGWESTASTYEVKGRSVTGEQIGSTGEPPWRVRSTGVRIRLVNDAVTHAYALDANGYPTERAPLVREGSEVSLKAPHDSMYVVLTQRNVEESGPASRTRAALRDNPAGLGSMRNGAGG
ncbi:hypothetical protein [Pirellulimonas nuda]|uniref:hypothetical protein n=1 Tax=Pirellulimonas nuda TaxID=2528009 RepID=UPI0011A2D29B|nr:hypothetical protein [Pirellulimonas nuda]